MVHTLVLLAQRIGPHLVPSALMVPILLFQGLADGLGQFSTLQAVAVVVPGEEIIGVLAVVSTKRLSIDGQNAILAHHSGTIWQVHGPAMLLMRVRLIVI